MKVIKKSVETVPENLLLFSQQDSTLGGNGGSMPVRTLLLIPKDANLVKPVKKSGEMLPLKMLA